jgi:hypothetical protein
MAQRFLQVIWRIEVVLKEKLHGPLARFTTLSHAAYNGLNAAAAKGNNLPMCGAEGGWAPSRQRQNDPSRDSRWHERLGKLEFGWQKAVVGKWCGPLAERQEELIGKVVARRRPRR